MTAPTPPSQHSGLNGGVDVLSDTMGWDYGPYVQRVIWDTEHAWWPIIPESARPPLDKQGKVMIRFKIYPDGSVHDMILEGPSGDVALDRAAWAGITGASPFPPIPQGVQGAVSGTALLLPLQHPSRRRIAVASDPDRRDTNRRIRRISARAYAASSDRHPAGRGGNSGVHAAPRELARPVPAGLVALVIAA